jgi:hypothetical protein
MPLTFTVDHARRRIHTKAHGPITTATVAQFFSDRITTGARDYDLLVDISAAEFLVHDNDLGPLANDRRASLGGATGGRTAWVAPAGEQHARALRLKELLEKLGVSVCVFENTDAAAAWLDSPIVK